MTFKPFIAAYSIAALFAGHALAQGTSHQGHGSGPAQPGSSKSMPAQMQHGAGHAGHGSASKQADTSPSSAAFRAANAKMHQQMDITFSGDADADFVRGMIPHHQGAVEMAKIVLAFGKDAELRKLAQEIVAAQEKEIAFMQEWLKKAGK